MILKIHLISTPTMPSSNPSKHIKIIYTSPNFDNLNSFTSISSSHPTLKPWTLPWVLCRILICSTLNSLGKFTLKWYRTTSFLGTVTASNSHVLEQRDPLMRRLGVLSNICRVQNRLRYCGKRRKNKLSEKCWWQRKYFMDISRISKLNRKDDSKFKF